MVKIDDTAIFSFIFVSILSLCHFLQQCKNCHDLCANLALTVWPCLAVIISPLIRTILNIQGKQPRLFPPPPAEEVCCTVTGAGTIKYGVKMYKNIFGIPQLCYNIGQQQYHQMLVANTNILFKLDELIISNKSITTLGQIFVLWSLFSLCPDKCFFKLDVCEKCLPQNLHSYGLSPV